MKNYLFTYTYQGSDYSLEIPADNLAEAKGRIAKIAYARYDGELVTKVTFGTKSNLVNRLSDLLVNWLRKSRDELDNRE